MQGAKTSKDFRAMMADMQSSVDSEDAKRQERLNRPKRPKRKKPEGTGTEEAPAAMSTQERAQ